MAKKTNAKYERQFYITAENLNNKNKTNKKLKLNPMAIKYETAKSKQIREEKKALQGKKQNEL